MAAAGKRQRGQQACGAKRSNAGAGEARLADLAKYVGRLRSGKVELELEGATMLRKLLSVEGNLHIDEVVAAKADSAGVPLFVTTTAPRNFDPAMRAAQQTMRDWILERFGDRAVDVWTGFALPDAGLDPQLDMGDGVHQNDAGHRLIFQRVRDAGLAEAALATNG